MAEHEQRCARLVAGLQERGLEPGRGKLPPQPRDGRSPGLPFLPLISCWVLGAMCVRLGDLRFPNLQLCPPSPPQLLSLYACLQGEAAVIYAGELKA